MQEFSSPPQVYLEISKQKCLHVCMYLSFGSPDSWFKSQLFNGQATGKLPVTYLLLHYTLF